MTILGTIGPVNDTAPDNGPYDVGITEVGQSKDGTRVYFQSTERLRDDDTDPVFDVYSTDTSDAIRQTVPSGGTVSTGPTPSETDPLETSVTPPGGGSVTIEEEAPTVPNPAGYNLLGYQTTINVSPITPPTAAAPIELKFRITRLCSRRATTNRPSAAVTRQASVSRSSRTKTTCRSAAA